jgi:hypothetical protein
MRITGYTYMADCHCPDCTRVAARFGRLSVDDTHPHGINLNGPGGPRDEHGLHYNLVDREGNLIRPVFDIDEKLNPTFCCDCGAEIT